MSIRTEQLLGSEITVPNIVVFRERLFVPSETFIRSQVQSMQRYNPLYVSRRPVMNAPEGVLAVSLDAQSSRLAQYKFALGGRSRVLEKLIKQEDARLVHAHFGPDGMLIVPTAERLSLPSVITLHGRDVTITKPDLIRARRPVAIRYALARASTARRATRILCVSDYLAGKAVELGMPPEKVMTHYIGVDTHRFPISRAPREPRFVHVARLVEKKGTSVLIDALHKISPRYPDAHVDIVGDGPLRESLEAMVNAHGLRKKVHFYGQQDLASIKTLLDRALAFVLPSRTAENGDQEGLPISILEAMSAGTPVISTRHSGIPEAIPSDAYGLLAEENDVSGLAERMEALLDSPNRATEVGLAAAQRVRQEFDLVRQSEKLEQIYDELLEKNSAAQKN
ncbi:glycosyltransferase [Kocuria sp. CPCC 205263]|uniref:glycosyltransferase n=1 Tax=Kocuria sp. CPCC 205263 TaxID=3073555 RepID=UPI0034D7328F